MENNAIKKEEVIARDKNITNNFSLFSINKNIKNHFKNSDVLQKFEKRINEVDEKINTLNLTQIQTIQHLLDIETYYKLFISSDDEIYQIYQNNKVLDKMVETQEERSRRNIINNAIFLKESNHEEKTALIWMTLSFLMRDKKYLDYFIQKEESINKIREVYPLTVSFVYFNQSCAVFSKFGVLSQNLINDMTFIPEIFNQGPQWDITLQEIYSYFPEIKKIYNSVHEPGKVKGTNYTSLIPNIENLILAASWLLNYFELEIIPKT